MSKLAANSIFSILFLALIGCSQTRSFKQEITYTKKYKNLVSPFNWTSRGQKRILESRTFYDSLNRVKEKIFYGEVKQLSDSVNKYFPKNIYCSILYKYPNRKNFASSSEIWLFEDNERKRLVRFTNYVYSDSLPYQELTYDANKTLVHSKIYSCDVNGSRSIENGRNPNLRFLNLENDDLGLLDSIHYDEQGREIRRSLYRDSIFLKYTECQYDDQKQTSTTLSYSENRDAILGETVTTYDGSFKKPLFEVTTVLDNKSCINKSNSKLIKKYQYNQSSLVKSVTYYTKKASKGTKRKYLKTIYRYKD